MWGLHSPKIRTLMALVFAVLLVVPILSFGIARFFENVLIRQTEEILVAEAVVVGEAYRQMTRSSALERLGEPPDESSRYQPFLAKLDLTDSQILPPARRRGVSTSTTSSVGAALSALLERTVVRNLSGVRVLGADGRVLASPEHELGYSLEHLPEVTSALAGDYGAALRRRDSSSPTPGLGSISRTAKVRVSIAVPVFAGVRKLGEESEVIGVVYNSRTPMDVSTSLWLLRDDLLGPSMLSLLIAVGVVALMSLMIASPLIRLRRQAEAVAQGMPRVDLAVPAYAPREVHALAESLARMREQLESRAEYIKTFAANAAHELKTPLTSLRGAAEILLDRESEISPERAERFLQNIRNDSVRMDRLVHRMLELARIEAAPPSLESVQLRPYLESLVERYERQGKELRLRYTSSREYVDVSPEQLESLIENLTENAFRYSEDKPVDVDVSDIATGWRIEVRDYGPHLPPDHFERIFDRFYTTDRSAGGTGLGLAIVQAIALAHGGAVHAAPREQGAAFVVTLPASDERGR